jgi:hypothetical protein
MSTTISPANEQSSPHRIARRRSLDLVTGMIVVMAAIAASGCAGAARSTNHDSTLSRSASSRQRIAINDQCPISARPIDPAVKIVKRNGRRVAFCCPLCEAKWDAWSEEQKEAFIAKWGE